MISSPNRSRRSGTPVRLVVIHTAEGARTTASLGNYFARSAVKASSHAGIDDHGIETYVPYSEASWTLRSGNSISDNVELCGFAAWTRGQWLTEHRPMLEHTARWIRERCQARGIPIRKLTPAQVKAGQAGVCGHHDWTVGMRDGTHTDPGPGFPWDVVIDLAAGAPEPVSPSPTPRPTATPEDAMYIKCQPDPTKPAWVAILTGPMFIGLSTPGEINSAEHAIKAGATEQWVELHTWMDMDRRSTALCANPRPIVNVTPAPPAPPPAA